MEVGLVESVINVTKGRKKGFFPIYVDTPGYTPNCTMCLILPMCKSVTHCETSHPYLLLAKKPKMNSLLQDFQWEDQNLK